MTVRLVNYSFTKRQRKSSNITECLRYIDSPEDLTSAKFGQCCYSDCGCRASVIDDAEPVSTSMISKPARVITSLNSALVTWMGSYSTERAPPLMLKFCNPSTPVSTSVSCC